MKLISWVKKKTLSFKIGLIIATVHFLMTLLFIIDLGLSSNEAQWELSWLIPYHFDFPASLCLRYMLLPLTPGLDFYTLPEPLGDIYSFVVPSLFHLLGGTLWYFYINGRSRGTLYRASVVSISFD